MQARLAAKREREGVVKESLRLQEWRAEWKQGVQGELHHHSLTDEMDYVWVMLFANVDHDRWKAVYSRTQRKELREKRNAIVTALLRAGLVIKTHISWEEDVLYCLIGAPHRMLEYYATLHRIPVMCKNKICVPGTNNRRALHASSLCC